VLVLGQGAAYAVACLAVVNAHHTSPLVISGLQLGWHCLVWNLVPAAVCLRLMHWGHRWLLRWSYRSCPPALAWIGCFFVFCIYVIVGLIWLRYLVWIIPLVPRVRLHQDYEAVLEGLKFTLALYELPGNSSDPDRLAILAALAVDSAAATISMEGVLLLLVKHWALAFIYQVLALLCWGMAFQVWLLAASELCTFCECRPARLVTYQSLRASQFMVESLYFLSLLGIILVLIAFAAHDSLQVFQYTCGW
jgi:hypothetical protein